MDEQYELKIDLNVLNHLGLNLYSNVPAVLAELVANAWDADATRVDISIAENEDGTKKITLQDNGCGMDEDDLQEKFLTVGYQRRKNEDYDKTPIKNRLVMGRKGIGKLSVFSIAKLVQVVTKKRNADPLDIQLDIKDIEEKINNKETYHPEPIGIPEDIQFEESGTVIILENLKKRINVSLDRNLRRRVARRFSVIGEDFRVFVGDKEVTWNDMFSFENLDCILVYGGVDDTKIKPLLDLEKKEELEKKENEVEPRVDYKEDSFVDMQKKCRVRGWIGVAKESGFLQDDSGNLNKISILTRGKMALEDILSSFREGGLYTKYVIGELEADFLDVTDSEDIATSSRQDFVQHDPRFIELTGFIKKELRYLSNKRSKIKSSRGKRTALKIPALADWYSGLREDDKKEALELFGKINQIEVDKEQKKELLKAGLLEFQYLQHQGKLSKLKRLDASDLKIALQLSSDLGNIEALWYYSITKSRLGVIRKLSEHIKKDELERVIQRHIYDHLWLLDPSWDRATDTTSLEERVSLAFNKVKEGDEVKSGRIDIKYKRTSGKHMIVELKRPSIVPTVSDLIGQVGNYIRALREELKSIKKNGPIEAVCLIGDGLKGWEDEKERSSDEEALAAKDIRVVSYKQLIEDAESSYKEYLEKNRSKVKIEELLEGIDEEQFTTDS